jgi:single-strand DNA-binding protein
MDTTLVGNLTRDPELRFTPSGQATASFGLAVNRTWTDRASQERREQTSFFDVVVWGTLAENVAQSLRKGERVVVAGRLDQRTWETQEGEKRSKVEVVADEVAPSLRWATAQVVKNDRRPADAAPVPSGNGHAATATAPAPASTAAVDIAEARSARSAPAVAPAPVIVPAVDAWADEEPF